MEEENIMECAYCGEELTGDYLVVGDNFLQAKYFESEESNRFCSADCVCRALSVLTVWKDMNGEEQHVDY